LEPNPSTPTSTEPANGPIDEIDDGGTEPIDRTRGEMIEIILRDGKVRRIQLGVSTESIFIGPDGQPVSAQQFIALLFDTLSLPDFFSSEDELRRVWSDPLTRRTLLGRLAEAGFDEAGLLEIQALIEAEQSDLFDVLEYVAFANKPISRVERVLAARPEMRTVLGLEQQVFIDFVLQRYIETGVEELDVDKLPDLLRLKYHALQDGIDALGGALAAREAFIDFQKYLYKVG